MPQTQSKALAGKEVQNSSQYLLMVNVNILKSNKGG